MKHTEPKGTCQLSGKSYPMTDMVATAMIQPRLLEFIRSTHPDWTPEGYVAVSELNKVRHEYVRQILTNEEGELSRLDTEVLESIRNSELLSKNVDMEQDANRTLGERIADKVADFGGSWTFIGLFFSMLFGWMILNTLLLVSRAFDPFPYILLNLILSCLAAIQAPIIMMSQNRQEDKDRLRAQHDYQVNLKAELEIRLLHEKIDHLLMNQGQKMMEFQQLQIDMLEQISRQLTHTQKE